jgi:predicted phosphate transport protein (TIGR00153 family)
LIVLSIIPRDRRFFDLFEQSAALVVKTAQTYVDMLKDYPHRERYLALIRQMEHDGDETTHRTLQKLDTTFITPFDREDIYSLMKTLDDVIDEIDAAAKRLILYKIDEVKNALYKQTDVLLRAAQCMESAVRELRNIKKPDGIRTHLIEIHAMENAGDDINHAAAAELYATSTNAIDAMKWKEIYDLTERAIDRCEDVANIIDAIILKNS